MDIMVKNMPSARLGDMEIMMLIMKNLHEADLSGQALSIYGIMSRITSKSQKHQRIKKLVTILEGRGLVEGAHGDSGSLYKISTVGKRQYSSFLSTFRAFMPDDFLKEYEL